MDEIADDDLNVSFGDELVSDQSQINDTFYSETLSQCSSFASNVSVVDQSTPKKSKRNSRRRQGTDNLFKVPKAPPVYYGRCTICKRGLKTERGLRNHMKTHRLKEAAKSKPDVERIIQYCRGKAEKVVQEESRIAITNKASMQQSYHRCLELLEKSLGGSVWNEYLDCILSVITEVVSKDSKAFPSSLRPALMESISRNYSSDEFRNTILNCFQEMCPDIESSIVFCVTLDLLRKLCDATVIFISQHMRASAEKATVIPRQGFSKPKDDAKHFLTQHVIHHVGGACLRSHVRMAHTYPKNKRLRDIRDCILARFAEIGSPSITERKNPAYWTSLINRRSLMFLRANALPFFIEVSNLLFSSEKVDGTLPHDEVLEKVAGSTHLLSLWDEVVGSSLNEDVSFSFMVKIVRRMTNAYGKGAVLRRMNEQWKRGKGIKTTMSVSHRARLI